MTIQGNAGQTRQPAFTPLFALTLVVCLSAAAFLLLDYLRPSEPSQLWTDKDFANYWTAARLALAGRAADLFGPHEIYFAHMRALFGPDYPWHNWSYPPSYLLTVLPLGFLDYKAALVLYLLATFLMLCGALRLSSERVSAGTLLLLLPVLATNGYATQNGYLLGALTLAGLSLRDRRPLLAGICIGLLTMKPQLGLLLPLLLLWERQWRVIAAATVTALALAGASAALFGLDAWRGYFSDVIPYQAHVTADLGGLFPHMMPTLFGSMRSMGYDFAVAMTVHLPFAGAVIALYCVSLLLIARPAARAASTVFATSLAVPYSLNYDLVALAAFAVLWAADRSHDAAPRTRRRVGFVAIVPPLTPFLGLAGWPVAPLLILAGWLLLLAGEGMFSRFGFAARPAGGARGAIKNPGAQGGRGFP